MEVLLKKNVEFLGDKDEIVSVKSGYGRNYIIPQGMGVLVTDSVRKMHEETLRQRSHKAVKALDEAKAAATKLEKASVKVGAKVGEEGKIFGSVTTIQVTEQLTAAGFAVDRKNVSFVDNNIKTTGKYKAIVKLHKEVSVEIEFEVVEG